MTIAIIATVTASIAYFTLAFVVHVVKGVCDRYRQLTVISYEDIAEVVAEPVIEDATVTDYDTIVPTPAKWSGFRPALVAQTANIYQHCTIRQLKKLASGRVKNYSKLTKNQLIAALA